MIKLSVYTSKYADVFYIPDQKLIEYHWKVTTEEMTDEEYRFIVFEVSSIVSRKYQQGEYQLENYLLDNSLFLYKIPEETRIWQRDYIFNKLIDSGGKKVAVVMSDGYLSQHLIEQTFLASTETNMITEYFDDIEKAKSWLLG